MSLSVWQIALVALLFILLFGRGKIPALMGDLAQGIKSFKKEIKDADPELEKEQTSDQNVASIQDANVTQQQITTNTPTK